MSNNNQTAAGDTKVGSSRETRKPEDLRRSRIVGTGRRGDIARKSVLAGGLATKAARKTFAQPQSDRDSDEAEHSDRVHDREPRTGLIGRPVVPMKSGKSSTAGAGGMDTGLRSDIAFRPETQSHSPTTIGRPVQKLVNRNPTASYQMRPPFTSNAENQAFMRNESISNGTLKAPMSMHLTQRDSGVHLMSVTSPFPHTPARGSISSAGRTPSSGKGPWHLSSFKSRAPPAQGSVDDVASRKAVSLRKTSVIHSGNKHAPRMVASSMSSVRHSYTKKSVKIDHADRDRNSDSEESSLSHWARRVIPPQTTSKTMPLRQAKVKAIKLTRAARTGSGTETSYESPGESSGSYVDEGEFTYSRARRQTKKKRQRSRSRKKLNWRQPPTRRREVVNAGTPADGTVDVASIVGNNDENGDGEKSGEGAVQSSIIPAQDSCVCSNMTKQPPSPPHLRASTVMRAQEREPSFRLPSEDALELPMQHPYPLAGHENSETCSVDSDSDGIDTESEDEAEPVERPASPSNNLIAALEVLTLTSLRMQKTVQLPFLRRNLRRGFADRCHRLGVRIKPSIHLNEPLEVELIFRLQTGEMVFIDAKDYLDEYRTHMISWNCPLCDLHGAFGTQAMLQKHIEWDHSEIKTRWTHDSRSMQWAIELYIPAVHMDQQIASVPTHKEIQRRHSQLPSLPSFIPIPSMVLPELPAIRPVIPLVQESPVYSKLTKQFPPPRPNTRSPSQTSSSSRSRPATATGLRAQTREPSAQPPLENALGPSAQYPYLPESTEDNRVYFSCRPSGPRIYDLLNTLPLAQFGTLSWFILDREQELFELNDILDEDKVLQALWGRWILLKRPQFLADYYKGTVAFIDEYWRIIHRAAGWAALRTWLLMFVVNRFLTGSEVAQILRHYESLTKTTENANENS